MICPVIELQKTTTAGIPPAISFLHCLNCNNVKWAVSYKQQDKLYWVIVKYKCQEWLLLTAYPTYKNATIIAATLNISVALTMIILSKAVE